MNQWDIRFNTIQFIYGTEPNGFFSGFLKTQNIPGKLLLPAEGEGRNAVFAAKSGWEVDAFDSSSVARKKALDFASREKVSINYDLLDLNNFITKPGYYNMVAIIFVHHPEENRVQFHQKIVQSLKKGGVVLVEAFAKEQLNNNSGGPPDINKLYSTDILRKDFAGLTIQKLSHEKTFLDEGQHRGMAEVVRLIAVKD